MLLLVAFLDFINSCSGTEDVAYNKSNSYGKAPDITPRAQTIESTTPHSETSKTNQCIERGFSTGFCIDRYQNNISLSQEPKVELSPPNDNQASLEAPPTISAASRACNKVNNGMKFLEMNPDFMKRQELQDQWKTLMNEYQEAGCNLAQPEVVEEYSLDNSPEPSTYPVTTTRKKNPRNSECETLREILRVVDRGSLEYKLAVQTGRDWNCY